VPDKRVGEPENLVRDPDGVHQVSGQHEEGNGEQGRRVDTLEDLLGEQVECVEAAGEARVPHACEARDAECQDHRYADEHQGREQSEYDQSDHRGNSASLLGGGTAGVVMILMASTIMSIAIRRAEAISGIDSA